jgi:predicted dinucleotide-utilizing enzyme
VILTTTKNPKSLSMEEKPQGRTVVFEGDANQAVKLFPRNINVGAAIALAADADLKVKIVADPAVTTNTHELEARGAFGALMLRVSNVPSPDNPRTSYLAALSVIRAIRGMGESLVIGV